MDIILLFNDLLENMVLRKKVGVLRHDFVGDAEKRIVELLNDLGYKPVIINPFAVKLGINPVYSKNHSPYDDLVGIISRCEINSGLSPEYEVYLRFMNFYEELGLPMINNSMSTVIAQDKFRTHVKLTKDGIQNPKSFISYDLGSVIEVMEESLLTFPFVIKDPYGSRGKDVYKISNFDKLKKVYDQFFVDKPILMQEYLHLEKNEKGEKRDMRIWVTRDCVSENPIVLGGIYRNATKGNFVTNVSNGGYRSRIDDLDESIICLSKDALNSVGADAIGLDVGRTEDGQIYVIEVNISPDTVSTKEGLAGRKDMWKYVVDLMHKRIEKRNGIYNQNNILRETKMYI